IFAQRSSNLEQTYDRIPVPRGAVWKGAPSDLAPGRVPRDCGAGVANRGSGLTVCAKEPSLKKLGPCLQVLPRSVQPPRGQVTGLVPVTTRGHFISRLR